MTTRFHITTRETIDHFGDSTMKTCTITGDGTYRGVFDYDGDDPDWIEECLESDENVLEFSREAPESAAARRLRLVNSPAQQAAARANGAKGGRPPMSAEDRARRLAHTRVPPKED